MKTSPLSPLYPRITATRSLIDLCGFWEFQFDPESKGRKDGWTSKLPNPITMPVPSSFADLFTEKEAREYTGDFWYEKDVVIPSEWRGRRIVLRFDGAAHRAIVFFNGSETVSHEGGFLPFTLDITELVKWGEQNRISVLLNNELSEKTLPVGRTEVIPGGKKTARPYFDFFNYSGLQRSVRLLALPERSIADFSVIHRLNGADAEVDYQVDLTGGGDVTVTVYNADGNECASSHGETGTLKIKNAKLWKIRAAYLYRFVIRLYKDNSLLDEWYDDIGIRTIEVRGSEILVNNESVYLKGFGKHEDSEFYGRGFNPAALKRDFELLKWIGANSFRTSHYPYAEEVYQLADREGILVIDESPAVGLFDVSILSAGVGASQNSKRSPFFERETIPALLQNHLEAVRAMIDRDKNRACVIAWSLFNEPDTVSASAIPYFTKIFDEALARDPQKRPRTFTLMLSSLPDTCKCFQLCDFISLNRYYGWYLLGGNETEKAEAALRNELENWKKKNLDKPFVFTEYGADSVSGIHKIPSVQWSEEYQKEIIEMNHRVFDSFDFVRGEQVWVFADFQTGEGIIRVDGNKKGVFDRQRQPKSAAFYLKQRWENLPLNHKTHKE